VVTVRPYQNKDARAIQHVLSEATGADAPPGPSYVTRWNLMITDEAARPREEFLVAEAGDGSLAGCAAALYYAAQPGASARCAARIYVRPRQRRAGTGRALLEEVARHFAGRGGGVLEAAATEGSPGITFCVACGFVEESRSLHLAADGRPPPVVTTGMSIGLAGDSDAVELAGLGSTSSHRHADPAFWRARIGTPGQRVLIARFEESAVGFALLDRGRVELEVRELYVHPAHRGARIGSALLAAAIADADALGVPAAFHPGGSTKLTGLFERGGFRVIGATAILARYVPAA
jgi:GNAT superfamily N-acetyltransferase